MVPFKVLPKSTHNQGRIIALDPGVRTFLIGFSESRVFKIGQEDFLRIARLCSHMEKLISKISKTNGHNKQKIMTIYSCLILKQAIWY